MVVDDLPRCRSVLGRGLPFEGYDVHLAVNSNEALSIAHNTSLDLVVL
jgi:DNA-binding response OmpR family regulator